MKRSINARLAKYFASSTIRADVSLSERIFYRNMQEFIRGFMDDPIRRCERKWQVNMSDGYYEGYYG